MKIGEPTKGLPKAIRKNPEEVEKLWELIKELPIMSDKDDVDAVLIPVEFETKDEAEKFAARLRHNIDFYSKVWLFQRGLKVFLGRKA